MSTTPSGDWTPTGPVTSSSQWGTSPAGAPQKPSGLRRILLWLIGGIFLAVIAFVCGILGLVMWSFHQSDVYRLAMEQARKNPEVIARLGQPLEGGMLFSGSMNVNGDTGSATMTIPIHGPKAKGNMYLDARKTMGTWSFTYLVVKTEAGDEIPVAGEPGKRLLAPDKPAEPASF